MFKTPKQSFIPFREQERNLFFPLWGGLRGALLLLMLLASIHINAHDIEVNGVAYRFIDGQQVAVVPFDTPYSGFVNIPDFILHEGQRYAVTRIDDKAFCLCSDVSSVSLPATLKHIGASAFAGCSSLSYITLPTSLQTIGDAAFSGCSQMLTVTLPAKLTHIGTQAFAKCSSLNRFEVDPENAVFATQDGILMNHDLTHIVAFPPDHASPITLPPTTRQIDSCAFAYCDKLTAITLPEGLLNIESAAFYQCTNLANVALPVSLEEIGMFAFAECESLGDITLSQNTRHIGDGAFSFCGHLQNIFVSNANPAFAAPDGVLMTRDQRTIVALPGGRKGDYRIPATVDSIAPQAFYGCHQIESVTLPAQMADIGENPFIFCDNLQEIHVDNANNAFQSLEGVLMNADKTAIVAVPNAKQGVYAVPEGVTAIQNGPFLNNAGITALSLPKTLVSIADYAFLGCYGLTSVNLPQSLSMLGHQAFDDCTNLMQIICAGAPISLSASSLPLAPSTFSQATLFVPKGSLPDYRTASIWSQFENISEYGIYADAQKLNRFAWQRIPIRLLPTLPITAFQAQVALPEGFELVDGNQNISLSSPSSLSSDTLCYITLRSPRDSQTGTYDISFNNITLNYLTPAGIGETAQKDFTTAVNLHAYRGDVNRNGRVNVADAMETILYNRGTQTERFHFEEADVNSNGSVNITDALQTIDIIAQEALAFDIYPIRWDDAPSYPTLHVPSTKAAMGTTTPINIHLNSNVSNLTAHQFILTLPQGIQLEQNADGNYSYEMSTRYADNHQLTIVRNTLSSESYSLVSASITGGTILPGNGQLLTLNAHVDEDLPEGYYEATLARIVFADTNATEFFLDDVRFNIFVTTAAGIRPATVDEQPTNNGIYNLQGQKVQSSKLKTHSSKLPPGLYIINGKKVVVR